MKKKFTISLVDDPTRRGRKSGAFTKPDELLNRIFVFWFNLVPSECVGTPAQAAKTTQHRLKVVVAANRLVAWKLHDADKERALTRIVFWIGKTELEKRLEQHDLQPEEIVLVHTDNYKQCPYDPDALEEPSKGAVFELEVERRIHGFAKS